MGHAWFSENLSSSPLITSTVKLPSASSSAVSIESAKRVSMPSLTTSLSTTTSIV